MCSGAEGITCFQKRTAVKKNSVCSNACSVVDLSVASNSAGTCQPSSTTEKATKLGTGLPSQRLSARSGAVRAPWLSPRASQRRASSGRQRHRRIQGAASTNSGAATTISSTCWIMCTQKSSALSRSIGEASAIARTRRLA